MRNNKLGVSLIVLVITITSTYDEANKIDRIPPENQIEIINTNKVTEIKSVAFNFCKSIV